MCLPRAVSLELGDHFSLCCRTAVGPGDVRYSRVRARVLTCGEAGQGVRERGGSQPGHQGGAVTCGLGRAHWVAVFGLTQHFRFLPCSWRPLPTKCLFAQHWPPPPRSPAPLQRDGPWRVGEVQHDPTDQLLGTRSVSLSWSCWGSPQWANPASSSASSRVNSTSTRRAQLEVSGPEGEGVASGEWKKCLGVVEKKGS